MKATGIVRQIDELRRVVIPMEIRKGWGILPREKGHSFEITIEGEYIKIEYLKANKPYKDVGIVRDLDDLGRIVVPAELRKSLDIGIGDSVEIFIDGEVVMLKKYESGCTFCGEVENVKNYKGKNICPSCLIEIKKF